MPALITLALLYFPALGKTENFNQSQRVAERFIFVRLNYSCYQPACCAEVKNKAQWKKQNVFCH